MPRLEITEVVFIHCNVVNNSYQKKSRVLYTFVPNKSLDKLLDIPPENFIFIKTFNSGFLYVEVLFTDQNFLKNLRGKYCQKYLNHTKKICDRCT